MNGPYFVAARTITGTPNKAAIRRLVTEVRRIDADVEVVDFREPGTRQHKVWAERPNDGMQDHPERRATNRRIYEAFEAATLTR